MKKTIQDIFKDSIDVKSQTLAVNCEAMEKAVAVIVQSLKIGGKILFFGNGGSAADSQHLAAEFIGRFKKERQALAAIALTTDSSILTALSNDYNFDMIFARQIEGLGREGDVAFGISTSGNSQNVVEGINKAKAMKLKTITMTGNGGGALGGLSDINLNVPSKDTARIQESHLCMAHAICELVENQFA